MTMSLYWEPAHRNKRDLPDSLKFVLRKKYGGSVHDVNLDAGDIQYLTGLADAGVEGAEELIKAIEKHGDITIGEY